MHRVSHIVLSLHPLRYINMGNLRQNILKTAESEFLKYGIRSVSIDDICEILRISKKTFYTEFRQKEELVSAVLEHVTETNKKEDKEYAMHCQTANAIDVALFFRHPALQKRRLKHEKFMRDLIKYYPDIHNAFVASNKEAIKNIIYNNIIKGVQEGLYRGELADVTAGDSFVALVYNMMMTVIDGGDNDLFALKIDVFMRLVCNSEGLEYYLNSKQ